ncbi:MAG: ParB N-terminal domain-containing protein [Eubacterium sp.]|nr:ParB N-terminal domain-containing protein [Eubacterium sp.]
MNLSNISKHAKTARNADIKRRETIIKENPQPVEPVLISQEPIITGEVHTEIPDEILMDMSELDAREAKEREENERKAAAETAPVPVLLIDSDELPQDLTEPVPEKEEYISAEDLIAFVDNFVDKYFPEKELRLEFSRLIPYHDMMFAPLDKTAMKQLCDDITDNGMNESLLVVPADDGVYKIISGHNRKQAAVTLGTWTKLYCRVGSKSALTDEICHQVMAITNLFRVRDMTALELTKMIAVLDNCEEIDHRISYFTGLSEDELNKLSVISDMNMTILNLIGPVIPLDVAVTIRDLDRKYQDMLAQTLIRTERRLTAKVAAEIMDAALHKPFDSKDAITAQLMEDIVTEKPKPAPKIRIPDSVRERWFRGKTSAFAERIIAEALEEYFVRHTDIEVE